MEILLTKDMVIQQGPKTGILKVSMPFSSGMEDEYIAERLGKYLADKIFQTISDGRSYTVEIYKSTRHFTPSENYMVGWDLATQKVKIILAEPWQAEIGEYADVSYAKHQTPGSHHFISKGEEVKEFFRNEFGWVRCA
jgi:hypothetical protein